MCRNREKREAQHLPGPGAPSDAGGELRAGRGRDRLTEQQAGLETVPMAAPIAYREIDLSKQVGGGRLAHEVRLAVRGRSQSRRYGGSDRAMLPDAPFDERLPVDRPDFEFSGQTDDRVRQWTAGIAYQGRIAGLSQINVGLHF
ncbi:hypothetical protein [Allosphingosinicella sp.]|uniref:hypothetical protein n=1 Tax=Allosphingosinicella sp. TaxID=2823234 RepID=UPI002FC18461